MLAGLRDTTGQPLMVPEVLRPIPLIPSNRMPTTEAITDTSTTVDGASMIFGYWPDCVVAFRHDFRLEVLRERYADSFQFGFLGHLRVDAQLFHGASFTRLRGLGPSGTT